MNVLQIENLVATRQGKRICSVDALQVERNSRMAVLGPNGSGKTTLLRILAGLEQDFAGTCDVAIPIGRRTYVHQQPWMFRRSVLGNLRYGQRVADERLHEIVDQLGIGSLVNRNARSLSGGEMRRVAIARSVVCEPQLLLLDEPLADLDDDASDRVTQLLLSLVDVTLVIASPIALPFELQSNFFSLTSVGAAAP